MEWISVEDRLPVNSGKEMSGENYMVIPAIVVIEGKSVYSEFHCGNTVKFWTGWNSEKDPTHWMPLPEPPKE